MKKSNLRRQRLALKKPTQTRKCLSGFEIFSNPALPADLFSNEPFNSLLNKNKLVKKSKINVNPKKFFIR